jgi:hypothetical protein
MRFIPVFRFFQRRHRQYRDFGNFGAFPDFTRRLKPGHSGHIQVQQNQGWFLLVRQRDTGGTTIRRDHTESPMFKHSTKKRPDVSFIVNYENGTNIQG